MRFSRLAVAVIAVGLAASAAARESIIICQAHPDDLSACLGFALKAKDRFDLHIVSYTGGEGGIRGKSHEEARNIRREEDLAVARELGATLHWIGETDGAAFATPEADAKLKALFAELNPRAVFLHFPIDLHPDHTMSFAAMWRAWAFMPKPRCEVYFFEEGGIGQTHNFHPNQYLETTDVWSNLVRITRLWKSQNANDSLVRTKTQEALFRGSQMITPKRYAEAYETLIGVPADKPTVFQEIVRDSHDTP